MMYIYLAIILGIFGAAIGSFINVCVDRLPNNKSLMQPPSHCDACQKRLSPLDLIPVISYIVLKGRCRYCGNKIPLRVLLVELGCGLLTVLVFVEKGLSIDLAIIMFYTYVFIIIGLIDLDHQLILDKIVFPCVAIALVLDAFVVPRGIVNSLEGAGVGVLIILIPFLATMGRGMGFGDVKMALLMGLAVGFPEILVAVLGGIILGGLTAIVLLVTRIKKRKDVIPFGPFLSIATIVALLWGSSILQWWQGIFMFSR
jgi:leader peptidase (prepilin peptidase) / N-methyltransferase